MTHTLTFQITTDTDPAELLDLLIEMSEQIAEQCDPVPVMDSNGFLIDGDEQPEAREHSVTTTTQN